MKATPLTHGDLFSGIGGFALAAEAMGWETRYFVEINEFAQKRLHKHFPNVPIYGDVRVMPWTRTHFYVDVLTAGFPCQPVSFAGRQKGESDPRWLWPEVARCVAVVRPRYIVLENVPGLLVHGMGSVLGSLSALGYDAEWARVSAASVGAPHLRNRIWIVGYASGGRRAGVARWRSGPQSADGYAPLQARRDGAAGSGEGGGTVADRDGDGSPLDASANEGEERTRGSTRRGARAESDGGGEALADTNGSREQQLQGKQSKGRRRTGNRREEGAEAVADAAGARLEGSRKQRKPGARPGKVADTSARTGNLRIGGGRLCFGAEQWGVEPGVLRVADGIPDRVDRIEALGNAVVPQVVVAGPFARVVQLEAERHSRRRAREDSVTSKVQDQKRTQSSRR